MKPNGDLVDIILEKSDVELDALPPKDNLILKAALFFVLHPRGKVRNMGNDFGSITAGYSGRKTLKKRSQVGEIQTGRTFVQLGVTLIPATIVKTILRNLL